MVCNFAHLPRCVFASCVASEKVCYIAHLARCVKKHALRCVKKYALRCVMFARDSGQNTHLKVRKNTHLFEKHALIKVCEFGDK